MKPDYLGLLRALHGAGIEHVIVGGVAAILEGAPITTLDLDIVFRVEEDNVRRLGALLASLSARYRDPAGRDVRPTAKRLATHEVNLLSTDLGLLDAMQRIGAGWTYADLLPRSARREVADLEVRVLGLEAVIESKRVAGRDKDRAMLPVLERTLEARERSQGT